VIARVLARSGVARVAEVGPGDDAAVLRAPDGRVVATTDVLVEGRHFRRDWSSAEDVGHKAAAANLADVAAMGGVTTALLVGLACPPDTPTTWLEGVAAGLAAECAPLGAAVVGGDTVASAPDSGSVVLSVTALGDLGGRAPVLRSGRGRGTSSPSRAGWAGRRAGWPCCAAGFSSPLAVVPRTAVRPRPTPPGRPRPTRGHRHVRRQRRAARRRRAPAPPTAASSWTSTAPRWCVRPWNRRVRCSRWRARWAPIPLAWVLTGGEDHALLATFPPSVALPDGGWPSGGSRRGSRGCS
jgi:thiamine-monophosphate kinase